MLYVFEMADTFCPLPWMFQAVRNNGDFRICCQANVSDGGGLLRFEDGRVANASTDSPSEVRNLPLMKDARAKMLKGEWPESCGRCQREEAAGLRSRRIYENESWGSQLSAAKAAQVTAEDGTLNLSASPVQSVDLRFGNKCNLKCRMCGPADSDAWYSDHVALHGPSFRDSDLKIRLTQTGSGNWRAAEGTYDWYDKGQSFWTELEANFRHIKHIHIVGGEPLLLKRHYQLLEQLVAGGYAKEMVLEYNTNLTILPDRVLNLWRNFKRVRIGVSLDGMGAVNEYIRFPSKWPEVEENLRRLDAFDGPIDAWISATIQIYNIFHLPDLIWWKLNAGFKRLNSSPRLPLITSHPVHRPRHLCIKSLPLELKAEVVRHFHKAKDELIPRLVNVRHPAVGTDVLRKKFESTLDTYVNFMNSEDSSEYFPEFLRITDKLDQIRHQRLADIWPAEALVHLAGRKDENSTSAQSLLMDRDESLQRIEN